MSADNKPAGDRRSFLKASMLGSAALAGAASGLFGKFDASSVSVGVAKARAADMRYKMAFIQWQPHTVPAAWSKGIEEVLKTAADRRLRAARRPEQGRGAGRA